MKKMINIAKAIIVGVWLILLLAGYGASTCEAEKQGFLFLTAAALIVVASLIKIEEQH